MSTKQKPCTLYIVRHGETEWNVQGILQGHADSPLTEKGVKDAQALAPILKKVPFTAVFSSDTGRAKRTAELISVEHQLALTTTALLRERNFGKYEGRKVSEYITEMKDLLEKMDQLNDDEKYTFKLAPDMESDEEIVTRFITFLRQTAVTYPGQNVLVVTHGGMIRTLLIHLGFGTRQELPPYAVKNLGFVKLESDGVDFFVKDTFKIDKEVVK